ncbi:sterol desaturase family protein [Puia dinghuensis]|nr:sterol desaturase family protein [Puia dinghuensis]
MQMSIGVRRSIWRDGLISVGLYVLPVALMVGSFWLTGQRPWLDGPARPVLGAARGVPSVLGQNWTESSLHTRPQAEVGRHNGNGGGKLFFREFFAAIQVRPVLVNLTTWGLPVLTLAVGVVEFFLGLYDKRWTGNEKTLDAVSFVGSRLLIRPAVVYFTLWALPWLFPGQKGVFAWVPFWWGFFIIAVADDLTQYWYHRLHHQIPWLWRFHRTHHSAPYMGMSMAGRQNIIYTVFFSQIYLTAALTYLGLGEAALLVTGVKSLITLAAHSSIAWDKPLYRWRVLHPVAWVLERLISTPATHHAHHAIGGPGRDSTEGQTLAVCANRASFTGKTDSRTYTDGDGVGHYKGNFGNMFFLWDVIFGTGIITRRFPSGYGIKHYKQEEWYAQFLWPIFKSRKVGSELARGGPVVGDAPLNGGQLVDAVLAGSRGREIGVATAVNGARGGGETLRDEATLGRHNGGGLADGLADIGDAAVV